MTVNELAEKAGFETLNLADGSDERTISGIYCCDLLSVAMSKGFPGAAWVTIMGNINAAAVASLTDMACVVLAEGAAIDEMMVSKAKQQGITVMQSPLPIFETAMKINGLLNA